MDSDARQRQAQAQQPVVRAEPQSTQRARHATQAVPDFYQLEAHPTAAVEVVQAAHTAVDQLPRQLKARQLTPAIPSLWRRQRTDAQAHSLMRRTDRALAAAARQPQEVRPVPAVHTEAVAGVDMLVLPRPPSQAAPVLSLSHTHPCGGVLSVLQAPGLWVSQRHSFLELLLPTTFTTI